MRSLTPHTVSWSFIDHVFFSVNNAVICDMNGVVYDRVPAIKVLCGTLGDAVWRFTYEAMWSVRMNGSRGPHPNLARFILEVHHRRK